MLNTHAFSNGGVVYNIDVADYKVEMKCKRCNATGTVDLGEGDISCPDCEGDGNLGEGIVVDLADDIADLASKLNDIWEKLNE